MSQDVGPTFAALADPTRRQVIALLADRGSGTATEIARELPVSRQAVAKHLAALDDAGLAAGRREGRETRYRLTPEPLAGAMAWMVAAGAQWDTRLERLKRQL